MIFIPAIVYCIIPRFIHFTNIVRLVQMWNPLSLDTVKVHYASHVCTGSKTTIYLDQIFRRWSIYFNGYTDCYRALFSGYNL